MKRLLNQHPSSFSRVILGILPFIILIGVYVIASDLRLEANPNDKLLPSLAQMSETIQRMAFEPNRRTGEYLFWVDTFSSLQRLILGVLIAASLGLLIGLLTGALPLVGASFSPMITVISLIPPLALLPILFIVFGLGELAKVALITIGILPFIARDMQRRTQEIPHEQIIKAQTLGANTSQVLFRVLLPQLTPRLLDAVRLSLGTGWLFLIAAEAIASTEGLGYRIFLVRRYMSMDVILPYVIWITFLAFLLDWFLMKLKDRLFPWQRQRGHS